MSPFIVDDDTNNIVTSICVCPVITALAASARPPPAATRTPSASTGWVDTRYSVDNNNYNFLLQDSFCGPFLISKGFWIDAGQCVLDNDNPSDPQGRITSFVFVSLSSHIIYKTFSIGPFYKNVLCLLLQLWPFFLHLDLISTTIQ